MSSNIQRLLNIIFDQFSLVAPEMILSLGYRNYLFNVLGKFGFGDNLISWIHLLYSAPYPSVKLILTVLLSFLFLGGQGRDAPCPLFFLLLQLSNFLLP